jgi:imidazolonepropionase-like amidohydrolase
MIDMKKLFIPLMILLTVATVSAQDQNKILLYNVQIIDVETGKIQKNAAVLIENNTIKAIGESNKLKRAAGEIKRIDGAGKYLIPGLWDMHVHLEGAELIEDNKALLPVFLAYGITTVRDCASDLGEQVLAWRKEINDGNLVGPTIFTAGRKLEGKNSIWKGDLEIENEMELNQMLDLLDTYKVDFVKITENTLSGDLFLKSVQAAKARGYRVSGHVPLDLTIDELRQAGYTSVEHASYLLRLGSDEEQIKNDIRSGKITKAEAEARYVSEFNQQRAIQKYEALGKSGLFVCPTLIGGRQLAYLKETDHSRDQFLNYLTEKYVSNYQWRIQRMANETSEQLQQRKDRYVFLRKQLPLIHKAGIKIIAGSDAAALNTYVYPAESLLQELEIFQEAGLSPLQILQTATINGAQYFNITDKTSTISVGKKADLVLLDKNPLENIAALRSVNSVIANGHYHNRESLDSMLKAARETKSQLDSQRK